MRSRSVPTGPGSRRAASIARSTSGTPPRGRPIVVFAGHAAPVIEVAFSADGTKLVSASQDATVKLWDLTSEPGVRRFRLEPRHGRSVGRATRTPSRRRRTYAGLEAWRFDRRATSWPRPARITRSRSGTPRPAG